MGRRALLLCLASGTGTRDHFPEGQNAVCARGEAATLSRLSDRTGVQEEASGTSGGSSRSVPGWKRNQSLSLKASRLAVTWGDGSRRDRAWSCEWTASSRADSRSRKVIPERSTMVDLPRSRTLSSVSRRSPREERSHSPRSSTVVPAPDSRTSIPYKTSPFLVSWWLRGTLPLTCGTRGVAFGLRELSGGVSRGTGLC